MPSLRSLFPCLHKKDKESPAEEAAAIETSPELNGKNTSFQDAEYDDTAEAGK
jgi:hypothetical protein